VIHGNKAKNLRLAWRNSIFITCIKNYCVPWSAYGPCESEWTKTVLKGKHPVGASRDTKKRNSAEVRATKAWVFRVNLMPSQKLVQLINMNKN
jgi:hypothetical protein